MPTLAKQILTELSLQTLHVGRGEDQFDVRVRNLSDRFAIFTLEVTAPGVDRSVPPDWYRLTPDLSAKIPAGDEAIFTVSIVKLPPISGGFTGKVNLSVVVTCLELGERDRQRLTLVVDGSGIVPPVVRLAKTEFEALPGDPIEIPVSVENHNRNTATIQVMLKGLPPSWLIDGYKRRLKLPPQGETEVLFLCRPPGFEEAVAHVYAFDIEASQIQSETVKQTATLKILPTGSILLTLENNSLGWLRLNADRRTPPTPYPLTLDNASNVDQVVAITLNRMDYPWWERIIARVQRRSPKAGRTTRHGLQLSPSQVALNAGEREQMTLTVWPHAPWVGWRRRHLFQLLPQGQQTEITPSRQQLELVVRPKIPFWLQCLAAAGLGLWLFFGVLLSGHRAAVNRVQLDGQANTVISGANDQTIRRWHVQRWLRTIQVLEAPNKSEQKAVRVVRYRPRNNDALAAGLENGEIQYWDFLSARSPQSLIFDQADRVFDLQFSLDSRSLFSAHGSGWILRWDLEDLGNRETLTTPVQQRRFDFAIQAIAPIDNGSDTSDVFNNSPTSGALTWQPSRDTTILAIGGRFNQLVLWDVEQDQTQTIPYPLGNQNQYITSLDTADNRPHRLAAADNQGRISLWNMNQCLTQGRTCTPTDQWSDGHRNHPVNAVALTKDACYLVSGGDDGRLILWSLNAAGQVINQQQLAKRFKPINSVDITQTKTKLVIVSGGQNHRVSLHRITPPRPITSPSPCP